MKQCVFLSMDSLDGYFCSDELAIEPLQILGWQVHQISWRAKNINWSDFDVVIVRSTWDYQKYADEFLTVLNSIEASSAILMNPLSLMKWNIDKIYLKSLAQQNIATIPTLWQPNFEHEAALASFSHFNCEEVVIKPNISGGSDYTYRLNRQQLIAASAELTNVFASRAMMVQPFIPEIVAQGEYSLFFFNNKFSHCIVKKPKAGDFRVQEEHGGKLQLVTPPPALLTIANKVNALLQPEPLYIRADFVYDGAQYLLIEVELIEPSLYFNMDEQSGQRFADAIDNRFGKQQ